MFWFLSRFLNHFDEVNSIKMAFNNLVSFGIIRLHNLCRCMSRFMVFTSYKWSNGAYIKKDGIKCLNVGVGKRTASIG